jgi:hypothetical protein
VDVTLVNTDFESFEIGRGGSPLDDWSLAAIHDGKPLDFSESGREILRQAAAGSFAVQSFLPGESQSASFQLSDLFDLTTPGRYQFTFSRPVCFGDGDESVQVECVARATVLIEPKK